MPTPGSAEWNRQQNIIRDNVVEAEPTILPELIIAEPLEDLNKSLKKKIKELTKQNEKLSTENIKLKSNIQENKTFISKLLNKVKYFKGFMDGLNDRCKRIYHENLCPNLTDKINDVSDFIQYAEFLISTKIPEIREKLNSSNELLKTIGTDDSAMAIKYKSLISDHGELWKEYYKMETKCNVMETSYAVPKSIIKKLKNENEKLNIQVENWKTISESLTAVLEHEGYDVEKINDSSIVVSRPNSDNLSDDEFEDVNESESE